MEPWRIHGGNRLKGTLTVQGAKNSVLPLLAASVLFREGCILENCPNITDVEASLEILRALGCTVTRHGHRIEIIGTHCTGQEIPRLFMKAMRSSLLFLGPILAKTGSCTLTAPGGCPLGERPFDLHLLGMKALGAEIRQAGETVTVSGHLRGADIVLPYPSVGATENILLAALGAEGVTRLHNGAIEPEIGDLIGFLQSGGAKISGAGTRDLTVCGGFPGFSQYRVMPDRMEAATLLCAVAGCGGRLLLQDARPEHLKPVLRALEAAGCAIQTTPHSISLTAEGPLHGIFPIRTAPEPGFPTDAQAPLMAALLRSKGTTVFEETVFSQRYHHTAGFLALGARLVRTGNRVTVFGTETLSGTRLKVPDLRGGAALLIAALQAQGDSSLSGIPHILRGYEDLSGKLRSLGAQITGGTIYGGTEEDRAAGQTAGGYPPTEETGGKGREKACPKGGKTRKAQSPEAKAGTQKGSPQTGAPQTGNGETGSPKAGSTQTESAQTGSPEAGSSQAGPCP